VCAQRTRYARTHGRGNKSAPHTHTRARASSNTRRGLPLLMGSLFHAHLSSVTTTTTTTTTVIIIIMIIIQFVRRAYVYHIYYTRVCISRLFIRTARATYTHVLRAAAKNKTPRTRLRCTGGRVSCMTFTRAHTRIHA